MNNERIEQISRSHFVWAISGKPIPPSDEWNLRMIDFAQAIRNEALEDACKTVYGQCGNDNVAQRTVDAIRKMKV